MNRSAIFPFSPRPQSHYDGDRLSSGRLNKSISPWAVLVLVAWLTPVSAAAVPDASLNLTLAAPIQTWDEAIPLGNGLLGGLLWGEANVLRLSLDRGDLWDLRTPDTIREASFTYANLQQLVRDKNQAEISRLFDAPYNHPTPTKIPGGRLEIVLDPAQQAERFELNLATAEGRTMLSDGRRCDVFFSAVTPVALLRIGGPEPKEIRLRVSGSGSGGSTGPDSHAVAKLGYPPAQPGSEGRVQWFVQDTAGSLKYCVCVASRRSGDATLLAVTLTSTADDPDPLPLARRRVTEALGQRLRRRAAAARRRGGRSSGRNRPSAFRTPPSCVITTWCGTSTARRRGWVRRPCRCKASGPPTPVRCRRGKATITTI